CGVMSTGRAALRAGTLSWLEQPYCMSGVNVVSCSSASDCSTLPTKLGILVTLYPSPWHMLMRIGSQVISSTSSPNARTTPSGAATSSSRRKEVGSPGERHHRPGHGVVVRTATLRSEWLSSGDVRGLFWGISTSTVSPCGAARRRDEGVRAAVCLRLYRCYASDSKLYCVCEERRWCPSRGEPTNPGAGVGCP
ncbi:unnamed protein product, partial [Pleuronectes platessa]